MERKIGAAGTSSHSIPRSRLGGILSDLQLDIVQNVIEHLGASATERCPVTRPTAWLKSESGKLSLAKRAPSGEAVRQFVQAFDTYIEWVS
jgi:hypothetical protein